MTYYIHPLWFYLISICDNIKLFLEIGGVLLSVACALAAVIIGVEACCEEEKIISRKCKFWAIIGAILVSISLFIPSKSTCIEMLIASKCTEENTQIVKEQVTDLIDYIEDKLEED